MLTIDGFLEQLVEQVELCRRVGFLLPSEIEQSQIAADLAQAKQAGQHLHALRTGVGALRRTPEPLLDFAQQRVVHAALSGGQVAGDDLLDLLRQIHRDIALSPPQQKRLQAPR
jgi:hypothetical protein